MRQYAAPSSSSFIVIDAHLPALSKQALGPLRQFTPYTNNGPITGNKHRPTHIGPTHSLYGQYKDSHFNTEPQKQNPATVRIVQYTRNSTQGTEHQEQKLPPSLQQNSKNPLLHYTRNRTLATTNQEHNPLQLYTKNRTPRNIT